MQFSQKFDIAKELEDISSYITGSFITFFKVINDWVFGSGHINPYSVRVKIMLSTRA